MTKNEFLKLLQEYIDVNDIQSNHTDEKFDISVALKEDFGEKVTEFELNGYTVETFENYYHSNDGEDIYIVYSITKDNSTEYFELSGTYSSWDTSEYYNWNKVIPEPYTAYNYKRIEE